jgi:hypothetical protein
VNLFSHSDMSHLSRSVQNFYRNLERAIVNTEETYDDKFALHFLEMLGFDDPEAKLFLL